MTTPPPSMRPWNLSLRFALEVLALVGIGAGAWHLTEGPLRWVSVVLAPLAGATAWATFNVVDDPSRSGRAPVEVPGAVRLGLEAVVLGAGGWGLWTVGWERTALVYAISTVVHYGVGWRRLRWLLA